MNPLLAKLSAIADRMRDECPALQADAASFIEDAWEDWARAYAPHLLIEQVGAVDDVTCQRNDYARKAA